MVPAAGRVSIRPPILPVRPARLDLRWDTAKIVRADRRRSWPVSWLDQPVFFVATRPERARRPREPLAQGAGRHLRHPRRRDRWPISTSSAAGSRPSPTSGTTAGSWSCSAPSRARPGSSASTAGAGVRPRRRRVATSWPPASRARHGARSIINVDVDRDLRLLRLRRAAHDLRGRPDPARRMGRPQGPRGRAADYQAEENAVEHRRSSGLAE